MVAHEFLACINADGTLDIPKEVACRLAPGQEVRVLVLMQDSTSSVPPWMKWVGTWRSDDPIIQVYRRIFPALFRAADEMPDDLRAHVRYPSLLVNAQAQAYLLYHMTNPQTFYNHEDL